MGDIFDQATAKPAAKQGDIFDQVAQVAPNAGLAPPAGGPASQPMKEQSVLPGSPETGLQGAVAHLGDTWNAVGKPITDVSAPVIAGEIYKKFQGQPNELKELPGKMVTAFAMGTEPGAEGEAVAPRPRAEAPKAPVGDLGQPGMLSRAWEVAKDRAVEHIPGAQTFKTLKALKYVIGGDDTPAPTAPTPAAPEVPPTWGKGQYGTPVDQWGSRIPQSQPPTPSPKAVPFERGALSKLLDKQLGDATGAAPPPDPKAPIYQRGSIAKQMPQSDYFSPEAHAARDAAFTKANPPEAMNDPMPPNLRALFQESAGFEKPAEDIGSKVRAKNPEPTRAEVKSGQIAKAMSAPSEDLTPIVQESVDKANAVPEGHTPVKSEALKSYKYDPQAREFHAQYNSNPSKVHIFGDVGPEEAQAFEAAKSKGTAMQAIKRNPEVARIVNGKRIAVKPVTK